MPPGRYAPTPSAVGNLVDFRGEDGRSYTFDVSTLPLPGWHDAIAASWAARIGEAGSVRTRATAISTWGQLGRMLRCYAELLDPPRTPSDLTTDHVDAYLRLRSGTIGAQAAKQEARNAALTFDLPPLSRMVSSDVRDRMRPHALKRRNSVPGYSDGELRRLVAAARADVATIRDRLAEPHDVAEPDRSRLESARTSGFVSVAGLPVQHQPAARDRIARRLFITAEDLVPMFVLLVVATGWNVEVIKDIPSRFRRIEDLAVEVEVTKRRRGAGRWHQTATWEIGPPHKELTTAGGLYLLFHSLMAPARALVPEAPFWATWHRSGQGKQGVRSTFGRNLGVDMNLQRWVRARGIPADPVTERDLPQPIVLNFNRLKTSIDVRRTRHMGGHLPSAARSNSTTVLFRNYLSGDPTTIEWAREVMADALTDVERAALEAHRKSLHAHGRTALTVRPTEGHAGASRDGAQTPWTACADHDHHPVTGRRCAASFLDCFHCGNCVITDDHLPRLLSLLDALEQRRHQMSDDAWWDRYGPTWAALRLEILPTFSEAELDHAAKTKPNDSLLDLVEPTWEQP